MSIGENLKRIRKEKGLTQVDFAKQIGVSRTYLSDLENNRKNLSTDTLKTLSKKLDVSMLYLMEGKKTLRDLSVNEKKNFYKDMKKNVDNFTTGERHKYIDMIRDIPFNELNFVDLKAIQGYISLVTEFKEDSKISSLLATIPDYLLLYGLNDYSENERSQMKQDLLLGFEDLLKNLEKHNL